MEADEDFIAAIRTNYRLCGTMEPRPGWVDPERGRFQGNPLRSESALGGTATLFFGVLLSQDTESIVTKASNPAVKNLMEPDFILKSGDLVTSE